MKKETKNEILGITKIRNRICQKRFKKKQQKQIQKDNVYLENAFANE